MARLSDEQWRVWWRRAFATFLVLALVIGLYLSFRPAGFEDEPQVAGGSETEAATATQDPTEQADGGEGGDGEGEDGGGEETEAPEAPDELTDAEVEELIAAARDPDDTSVQVLDAGGGGGAADEVAELLRELGYDVVAVNPARQDWPATEVLFTEGNEAEAQALRAREQRVTGVAPNELLSDGVDLHVMVGPDWES